MGPSFLTQPFLCFRVDQIELRKDTTGRSLFLRYDLYFGGQYHKPPHPKALFSLALAAHQRTAKLGHRILLLQRALSWLPVSLCCLVYWPSALSPPQWHRTHHCENNTGAEWIQRGVSSKRHEDSILVQHPWSPKLVFRACF